MKTYSSTLHVWNVFSLELSLLDALFSIEDGHEMLGLAVDVVGVVDDDAAEVLAQGHGLAEGKASDLVADFLDGSFVFRCCCFFWCFHFRG